MMTFFTILLVLIGVNAIMMVFSLNVFDRQAKKKSNHIPKQSVTKIYPLDFVPSKYKKAV